MDTLDRIRVFQVVADQLSFAEAARQLRIAPVAATRAVAALEAELGVQLLRRTTRSVALTERGSEYLARSRRALEELDDAGRSVRGEDATPRGQLVATAPVLFGRMHVMPIVNRMLRSYPDLSIRLILLDRVVRLAEEGFDLAVRIAQLRDSALRASPLASVSPVLVASPAYLARKGTPKKHADLADHDLIAFDSATLNNEARRNLVEARIQPRFLTNSIDASLDAALQGFGIARLFSYHVAGAIAAGKLVQVLKDVTRESIPVNIVFQSNRQQSPNLKAFLAEARRSLPDCPEL
jgi:DNA-binding transcriptional LysR family regulator